MDRFKAHEDDPLPCKRDGCAFQANNVEGLGVHILNTHASEPYVLASRVPLLISDLSVGLRLAMFAMTPS
jgi:hypothetical protein